MLYEKRRESCGNPWTYSLMTLGIRLCVGLGILLVCCAKVATASQPPLDQYLATCADRYSEEHAMIGQRFSSPGYHSQVPSGTWVHPVVPSLDYAVGLLMRGRAEDRERAVAILRKVISLQDTDPQSRTYGIWPWLLEEPLEKMSPPDWNWADFCGARLALVLADHRDALPEDLRDSVRNSLRHAAEAIRKRNVGPSYTNIAIMGGGVCAAAGELLNDVTLLEYGRTRLEKVVAHTAEHGSFNEYNSPTYTIVALVECERILHLVRDEATRAAAESLRQTAWRVIADSFHPGTGQWAGPHARSNSDYVFQKVASYLSEQTGVPIPVHSRAAGDIDSDLPLPWHLPCPEDLRERFRKLPTDPIELRRTFVRGGSEKDSTIGVTWLSSEVCLGSVNRGTFWTQARPVIGYWKTPADPAVVLRVRFLHDGRDFASMGLVADQSGNKCLMALRALSNSGDWHPVLDRPEDGRFEAADFRLRIELVGNGVAVTQLGDRLWSLGAGNYRAVIRALDGRFGDRAVQWAPGRDTDRVFVDAIAYQGPKTSFDFRPPPEVVLVTGLEILRDDEEPSCSPEVEVSDGGGIQVVWQVGQGLHVDVGKP